jgi:hypothetical protein
MFIGRAPLDAPLYVAVTKKHVSELSTVSLICLTASWPTRSRWFSSGWFLLIESMALLLMGDAASVRHWYLTVEQCRAGNRSAVHAARTAAWQQGTITGHPKGDALHDKLAKYSCSNLRE